MAAADKQQIFVNTARSADHLAHPVLVCGRAAGSDNDQAARNGKPRNEGMEHAPPHTITWLPSSTARPDGIWKKSVALVALRARKMNK